MATLPEHDGRNAPGPAHEQFARAPAELTGEGAEDDLCVEVQHATGLPWSDDDALRADSVEEHRALNLELSSANRRAWNLGPSLRSRYVLHRSVAGRLIAEGTERRFNNEPNREVKK